MGTAYSSASRVWFTLSHGILNEVYFPTADSPQIRDLEFLITDGESFFHEEKRDLETQLEYLNDNSLGYRLVSTDHQKRYRIVKETPTVTWQANNANILNSGSSNVRFEVFPQEHY